MSYLAADLSAYEYCHDLDRDLCRTIKIISSEEYLPVSFSFFLLGMSLLMTAENLV